MEQEPHTGSEERPQTPSEEQEPPSFDPDSRLVTYLEGGSKADAERRFRIAAEEQGARPSDSRPPRR